MVVLWAKIELTCAEKPFASFTNQFSGTRPGTFVPVAVVSQVPQWVRDEAAILHGTHEVISEGPDGCYCVVLSQIDCCDWRPPGDWLIYYHYNETDGTHAHSLCVAARISPDTNR